MSKVVMLAVGVALLIGLTGCAADVRDRQITELQRQKEALARQNADLQNRLNRAMADLADARALLDRLQKAGPPTREGDWITAGMYTWINIAEDILFDSGKADFKPAGRAKLEEVVAYIHERFPDRNVWVVGHTDRQPIKHSKWKDNLELSVQRGASVTRELYALGLDPAAVFAGGQGEHYPLIVTDQLNVPQNRRVQIIAVPKPPKIERPGEAAAQPAAQPQGRQPTAPSFRPAAPPAGTPRQPVQEEG
jgi:flagellar motor protein MotB